MTKILAFSRFHVRSHGRQDFESPLAQWAAEIVPVVYTGCIVLGQRIRVSLWALWKPCTNLFQRVFADKVAGAIEAPIVVGARRKMLIQALLVSERPIARRAARRDVV